jgi:hypothetical protein
MGEALQVADGHGLRFMVATELAAIGRTILFEVVAQMVGGAPAKTGRAPPRTVVSW